VRLDALQLEIRPRTAGQTLSIAARMLQHRPGPIVGAWVFCGLLVLGLASLQLIVWELPPWWVWLFTLFITPLFSLPMVSTIGHLVFSPTVSFSAVVRMTSKRLGTFAALFFFNRVLTVAGATALIFPGLLVWHQSWFLAPIVMLEGADLRSSQHRCRRFALGFQGRVIWLCFHTALFLIYGSIVIGSLFHLLLTKGIGANIAAIASMTRYDWYADIAGLVGFSFAAPLATLVWFFVYLDVRIRKEGWDLELAFRSRQAEEHKRLG
jgi:hypothetical protein